MLEFPLASAKVKTTLFDPIFAQVNAELESVEEVIPQLSVLPALMLAAVMLALPAPFRKTVRFWQTAVGAILSITVTINEQESTFPATSVAL